jgi:hypothetical protein
LRPLFPAKPEPPLRGGAIIIGDDLRRKPWQTISKAAEPITQLNLAISRHASPRGG